MARLKLKDVQAAIKEKGASWEADETEISPYLDLDISDMGLFGLSLDDSETLFFKTAAPTNSPTLAGPNPPPCIDWRDFKGQNWVTKIRNQETCGACVACAICAVLESRAKWGQNNPNLPVDLSVAHLFFVVQERLVTRAGRSSQRSNFAVNMESDERTISPIHQETKDAKISNQW